MIKSPFPTSSRWNRAESHPGDRAREPWFQLCSSTDGSPAPGRPDTPRSVRAAPGSFVLPGSAFYPFSPALREICFCLLETLWKVLSTGQRLTSVGHSRLQSPGTFSLTAAPPSPVTVLRSWCFQAPCPSLARPLLRGPLHRDTSSPHPEWTFIHTQLPCCTELREVRAVPSPPWCLGTRSVNV